MSISLIIFILIHVTALVYFLEVLRRIHKKVHEYNLQETDETLPFGLIRLRHLVILYVLAYLVWVVGSLMLYLFVIAPSGAAVESVPSSNEVILDL